MNTQKLLVSGLMFFSILFSACQPAAPRPTPVPDSVFGTFTYTDTEADPDGNGSATFPRPIIHCLVQVWRAGVLVATIETDDTGFFNAPLSHMPDGTDTTILLYATNAAAQVLAASGPFFVQMNQLSSGATPLDFSTNFGEPQEIRSFNAAEDIRLAFNFASGRRDPSETEVIPRVDVSFNDIGLLMTHYNQPAGGLVINLVHNSMDLVIFHEYAHFLEDKIGSFLLLPSYHNGCFTSQRCINPAACNELEGLPDMTQLINSPENAWMEGFADYFAMAVKRANLFGRFNLTRGGTATEATLDQPNACAAVGRPAFDGRTIDGEMIEYFVASALWQIGDGGSRDSSIFQVFDRELDGSATGVLPNITLFCRAWLGRFPEDKPRLHSIFEVNFPVLVATYC